MYGSTALDLTLVIKFFHAIYPFHDDSYVYLLSLSSFSAVLLLHST